MIGENGFSPVPSIIGASTVITNRTVETVKLGHMFIVQKVFRDIDVESVVDFLVSLGAVTAQYFVLYEFKYKVSQGKGIGTFYEKGDYAGGTAVPIFNRNEKSSQTPEVVITKDPVGTTPGTEGQSYLAGGETQGNNLAGGTSEEGIDLPTEVNTAIDRLFRVEQIGGVGTFDLDLRIVFAEIPAP